MSDKSWLLEALEADGSISRTAEEVARKVNIAADGGKQVNVLGDLGSGTTGK